MLIFKSKMTPAELAELTGYTPQTINKWARSFGWVTSQLPGVKGGKAQVIHVDAEVRSFLLNTGRVHQHQPDSLSEPANQYQPLAKSTLEDQLLSALTQLNEYERTQFSALLLREGIAGVLQRLGIRIE